MSSYKADFARESASTLRRRRTCLKEIETKDLQRILISWRMLWMSMSFSFEEIAEMRVLESDQMVIDLHPTDTASMRAVLTAMASAIRAEPTWLRFEDIMREVPLRGSWMIHPDPPNCVVTLQAASTKHWGSIGGALTRLDLLLSNVGGFEAWLLHCCAFCQARASLIATVTTSCSESRALSKQSLFLALHIYQRIQGNRAASESPSGGRLVMRTWCWRSCVLDVILKVDGGSAPAWDPKHF